MTVVLLVEAFRELFASQKIRFPLLIIYNVLHFSIELLAAFNVLCTRTLTERCTLNLEPGFPPLENDGKCRDDISLNPAFVETFSS